MRKSFLWLAAMVLFPMVFGTVLQAQNCGPFTFRSYNIADTASAESAGLDTFQLSQNYPTAMPEAPKGGFPWEKADLKKGSAGYMRLILDYFWEGMDSAKFVAQNNKVRPWYHAPWLDAGYAGREFAHGLVMDRTSLPGDLFTKQKKNRRNYSITYYNPQAAYTLGQVWCDPKKPDPAKAKFPVGSVWVKLVFTTADTSEVPTLLNAMEWESFIELNTEQPIGGKELKKVRLIEIDFGVRTAAKEAINGWVFGVYVFQGLKQGASIKEKMIPIGLQWGNDPGMNAAQLRAGEKQLQERWMNPNAWNQDDPTGSLVQKLGWGNRLKGPIGDNTGSIMSDHMTAGWPPAPRTAPSGLVVDSVLHWFRNVPTGTPFDAGQVSLDYSLELMDGIRNHAIANGDSLLDVAYLEELTEMLGFRPTKPGEAPVEAVKEEIHVDEGLTGSNLWVFIGFVLLLVTLVGLLVMNFMKK
jgi:hypothetical protein